MTTLGSIGLRFGMPLGGDIIVSVDAFVRGEWAAHELTDIMIRKMGADPIGGWRVSHVRSGLSIAQLADDLTSYEAREICRALADAGVAFDEDGRSSDADMRWLAESIIAGAIADAAVDS